ncbi:MAG: metalloregulator ArsR/SmtB family transcription factor [Helicobacter sp.]|nr:metalloregulator ArsR/SmtB family transcription factor [Helicobacter sp.]
MSEQNKDDFLKIIGAVNDESRVRILAFLSQYSQQQELFCVCDLQEALEMNQSRLSRHLKILKDAGFLELQRKGVWAYYGIKKDLDILQKHLLEHIMSLNLALPKIETQYEYSIHKC